jgi:RHS repeat-associated protein
MPRDEKEADAPLSLPTGGGAISGIGETFQPNLFSGTADFSIPIPTTPGRAGFGPQLSLRYSSGNGNGPFGLGWQLSVPRIARKTEKGLPRYDARDCFVLSGLEDLVPRLARLPDGDVGPPASEQVPEGWRLDAFDRGDYRVTRYRPRTEGLFARIEHWQHPSGDSHWRGTTRDNRTSIYGRTARARVAAAPDAGGSERVYEWLLEETFDAKGNHILYEYAGEAGDLRLDGIQERHRDYGAQRYLRRILYGNTPPDMDGAGIGLPRREGADHDFDPDIDGSPETRERAYLFEMLFDYGDLDANPSNAYRRREDRAGETLPAHARLRPDPFSSFRAGFEVRTLRRCERVLMFHHAPELKGDAPTLVKAMSLEYAETPASRLSLLTGVQVNGYRRRSPASDNFEQQSLPPLSFDYSTFEPNRQRYQAVTAEGGEMPLNALSRPGMALVDVFGDGLPDPVETVPGSWRHWRNLGGGRLQRPHSPHGPLPTVQPGWPGVAFADLGGDGLPDLLVQGGPLQGFFESTPAGGWRPFRRVERMPDTDANGAGARLVDLTGDGRSDLLVTRDQHFLWYRSLGERGYDPEPKLIPRRHDLDEFPDVYFDDPSGRVRLADMTGDGLADIVLVHDGRIDYWPNLGYGRFGRRITMAAAPRPGPGFAPARLFLADLDGSGCADLVYVEADRVRFWLNQSGNAWSGEQVINGTPFVTDSTSVRFADFYGIGTSTLVWSRDASGFGGSPLALLDFCGGTKPYLLTAMDNNLGATTRIQYAPSTKFYLEDRERGEPWATNLPFPVQVVEQIESIDHISRTKLVTRFAYHHGYYDGREREFRGFGRVDQFDTRVFSDFKGAGLHGNAATFTNKDEARHLPPVETRTWFHTGVHYDPDRVDEYGRPFDHRTLAAAYAREYFQQDPDALRTGDHQIEVGDTPHLAFRALRGAVLRTEVYGRDGTDLADRPYVVTEHRYQVRQVQPESGAHDPVFHSVKLEDLKHHYERETSDPRVQHSINLRTDALGNVTDSVTIGYPRRQARRPSDLREQAALSVLYTHADVINRTDDRRFHFIGLPCQQRSYEITGLEGTAGPLASASFDGLLDPPLNPDDDAHPLPGDAKPYGWIRPADHDGPAKRLIDWTRHYYRADASAAQPCLDLDDAGLPRRGLAQRLPLGHVERRALPYESYQAALTDELVLQRYGHDAAGGPRLQPDADLPAAGYHQETDAPGHWWIPSGQQVFDPDRFWLPVQAIGPFAATTVTAYDRYALLITAVTDSLGNRISVETRDDDGAAVTGLDYHVMQPWMVEDPNGNRSAVQFDALGQVTATAVMARPGEQRGDTLAAPTTRLEYDLFNWRDRRRPVFVRTLARETHGSATSRWQETWTYSDGFGRTVQTKTKAEPGKVGCDGRETDAGQRWVGSGWTVYDNKGNPVEQYEPFFSATAEYEAEVACGVTPRMTYDPLGRLIRTDLPDGCFARVIFSPWHQETQDANDTVIHSLWYTQRAGGSLGDAHKDAADKAATHAGTPTITHLDGIGRAFLTVRDGGSAGKVQVRTRFDIEGNALDVTDPRGNLVFANGFDLAGRGLSVLSADAGVKLVLPDVAGKPVLSWDANGNRIRTDYDALRRPVATRVRRRGQTTETLTQLTRYGESLPDAAARNLRTRAYRVFDGAGVATHEAFDFKGNPVSILRELTRVYDAEPDWQADMAAPAASSAYRSKTEAECYRTLVEHDALNRVVRQEQRILDTAQIGSPDPATTGERAHLQQPGYNAAGLLETLDAWIGSDTSPTRFVRDIDYDAKGQRTRIEYGNGVSSRLTYDTQTFRLRHIETKRADGSRVQDLTYVYDPVGNITRIHDAAFDTVFNCNQRIEPVNGYTYDPLYRLIEASGREHRGMTERCAAGSALDDLIPLRGQGAADCQNLRNYTERYQYDAAGNITLIHHQAQNGGWQRIQTYAADSNRLATSSSDPACPDETGPITHDLNGNITALPHLNALHWDHANRLRSVELKTSSDGIADRAYYGYDAAGMRIRKVVVRGDRIEERLYLGGFEIERARNGAAVTSERRTVHILDGERRVGLVQLDLHAGRAAAGSPPRTDRYQLQDHLGSSAWELDTTGATINHEEYMPYGRTAYVLGKAGADGARKRYRYSGKERDEETGLYYYGARYYAPWCMRWSSCDPLGYEDGLNPYLFVHCNPLRNIDTLGLQADRPPLFDDATIDDVIDNFEDRAKNRGKGLHQHAVKLNVDEATAVANGGSWDDPANKQFLEEHTNQHTKNSLTDQSPAQPRRRISLAQAAAQGDKAFEAAAKEMLTSRFSDVAELDQITREARNAMRNTNGTPRELANRINKSIRGRIARGATPHAALVKRALEVVGFDAKALEAVPEPVPPAKPGSGRSSSPDTAPAKGAQPKASPGTRAGAGARTTLRTGVRALPRVGVTALTGALQDTPVSYNGAEPRYNEGATDFMDVHFGDALAQETNALGRGEIPEHWKDVDRVDLTTPVLLGVAVGGAAGGPLGAAIGGLFMLNVALHQSYRD